MNTKNDLNTRIAQLQKQLQSATQEFGSLSDDLIMLQQTKRAGSDFITLENLSEKMKQTMQQQPFLNLEILAESAGVAYRTAQANVNDPFRPRVTTLVKMLDVLDLELVVREK